MIKANLASRKQSAFLVDSGPEKLSTGFNSLKNLSLQQIRELPIVPLLLPFVAAYGANYLLNEYKQKEIEKIDSTIQATVAEKNRIQNEVNSYKRYDQVKINLEEDEKVIRTKLETIKKLISDRSDSPKILLSISNSIPNDVWLSEFSIENGEVIIKGSSVGFNLISDFMKGLNENVYLTNVDLKDTQQQDKNSENEIANFELVAKRR